MADDERLTKKERREKRRRERRRKEAEEARAARRRRILTIAGTIAAVAGIAAVFWFTREPPVPDETIVVQAAEVEEAIETAGCEAPDIPPPTSADHIQEPGPPADQLYPVRPTHGGPHFGRWAPVGTFSEYADERETTHNLEHGSVIAWWDPDEVDDPGPITEWADVRLRMGFNAGSGGGIIAAPFEHSFGEDDTIALRAWGVALDCEEWDETVADAFLASNYGTNGQAPERSIAQYPQDALRLEGTVDPTGGEPTADEPDDGTSPEDAAS